MKYANHSSAFSLDVPSNSGGKIAESETIGMDGRDDALAPSNEDEADGSSIVVRVVVVCSASVRSNARAAVLRVYRSGSFSMMTMT